MLSITGRNVNEIYPVAMMHFSKAKLCNQLLESSPRGERRWQWPTPLATTYQNPCERVLFDAKRDANPFFHFMESLWILAGRDDVAWLVQWLKSIANFSDAGETFYGSYGKRLHAHGQLGHVIHRLSTEPDTTRAVLQLYDVTQGDSTYTGKDLPCNTSMFLGIANGRLNLTVANRSNDLIWGAYGANVVQFSTIQEYLAGRIGCKVGWYCQFSNNAHIYPDKEVTQRALDTSVLVYDPYLEDVTPYPMGAGQLAWQDDLDTFFDDGHTFRTPFFAEVVAPIKDAHLAYREKFYDAAIRFATDIAATDWRLACVQWLQRRRRAANEQTK